MGSFLKFLLHLAVNIVWQRVGGKGGIPPVRFPKGKKPVDIPILAPWQMMAAMWVAKRVWGTVGEQVKTTLATSPNTTARQVGALLPDPPAKAAAKTPVVPPKAAKPSPFFKAPVAPPAPRAPQTWTAPAQPAAPAPPAAPRPAQDFGTRKLDDADGDAVTDDAPAPNAPASAASGASARVGSLLSSLRRGKTH